MERFLRAWDEHLTDPSLPRTLSARLRDAGFEDVDMQGHDVFEFVHRQVGELADACHGQIRAIHLQ